MSVSITSVTKALPKYVRSIDEIIPYVEDWMSDEDERKKRKAIKVFQNAGVDKRYSIMHPDVIFSEPSFEKRNTIYKQEVKELAVNALSKGLEKAAWQADEIDFIITVSCTGIMIPSLDAYLVNELNMKQGVIRLPVTEMGCAAGVSGLIYAHQFLKQHPGKKAAVIAVESPTATFQLNDFSMTNIVSAAIFGDGAACVLLSSDENHEAPQIVDHDMYHFYDTTDIMGFTLVDTGLRMILDKEVPTVISNHFHQIVHPFLSRNKLEIADINHLIFHPGGKKIVQAVEALFGDYGKQLEVTKRVLQQFGNMSSATVLYVLEEFLNQKPKAGDYGLMLSFGPGFSAQSVLLQW